MKQKYLDDEHITYDAKFSNQTAKTFRMSLGFYQQEVFD